MLPSASLPNREGKVGLKRIFGRVKLAKYFLIGIVLILGSVNGLRGQDAIVTLRSDTIRCLVVEQNDKFVYYRTAKTRAGNLEVISQKEVVQIIRNYGPPGKAMRRSGSKYSYDRIWFSGSAGYSRLLTNTSEAPEDFKEYYNALNNGYFFSAEAGFMLRENTGVGLVFAQSKYANSAAVINTTTGQTGDLIDDITLSYYGVQALVLLSSFYDGSSFFLNIGVGLNTYRNNYTIFYPFQLSGNQVGAHVGGGFRWQLSPGISVPAHLMVRGFQVMQIEVSTDDATPAEWKATIESAVERSLPFNVARIELGVGLLISF